MSGEPAPAAPVSSIPGDVVALLLKEHLITPEQVRIYNQAPPHYEEIAVLETQSGGFTYGEQNKMDEVLANLRPTEGVQQFRVPKGLRNLLPNGQDFKDCRFAFLNGSLIGFFIGVLPGAGSTIASFVSYGVEKAVSRRKEQFGTGVIEGVAAPEAANNSETGGALVPLLTLGIPGSGTTAILLAAFILWGMRPGPLLIQDHPEIFWGLVASMYIGNVMLLIFNLPLVPLFAQILRLPAHILEIEIALDLRVVVGAAMESHHQCMRCLEIVVGWKRDDGLARAARHLVARRGGTG